MKWIYNCVRECVTCVTERQQSTYMHVFLGEHMKKST